MLLRTASASSISERSGSTPRAASLTFTPSLTLTLTLTLFPPPPTQLPQPPPPPSPLTLTLTLTPKVRARPARRARAASRPVDAQQRQARRRPVRRERSVSSRRGHERSVSSRRGHERWSARRGHERSRTSCVRRAGGDGGGEGALTAARSLGVARAAAFARRLLVGYSGGLLSSTRYDGYSSATRVMSRRVISDGYSSGETYVCSLGAPLLFTAPHGLKLKKGTGPCQSARNHARAVHERARAEAVGQVRRALLVRLHLHLSPHLA